MQLLSTLVHNGTEYFTADKVRHIISDGKIEVIDHFPKDFYNLLLSELMRDQRALRSLAIMGITVEAKMVEVFFDCNFSAFGGDADVTNCGQLGDREVVKCSQRDNCQFEGRLCRLPKNLTKREAQVARAIARGLMDDEITAILFISQNTLRNHKNNIENKIGATGKLSIGLWTQQVGLI